MKTRVDLKSGDVSALEVTTERNTVRLVVFNEDEVLTQAELDPESRRKLAKALLRPSRISPVDLKWEAVEGGYRGFIGHLDLVVAQKGELWASLLVTDSRLKEWQPSEGMFSTADEAIAHSYELVMAFVELILSDLHELEKSRERLLFAVVDDKTGKLIQTGAPFDGTTQEEVEKEVAETYFPSKETSRALADAGWRVVPLTHELETQYDKEDDNDDD